ncbi:uncharacterized protein [Aquarana catesbeiana]|uniref:uncharacterized protein n=1 Tax=Aquarana catesbeiana TaxID=8400 RepID=UPI003CC9F8A4
MEVACKSDPHLYASDLTGNRKKKAHAAPSLPSFLHHSVTCHCHHCVLPTVVLSRMSVSRREVVHREPIDNECLIRLVRQRPCLYDKDDPTYRDQIKKDNAWLEICRGSFEDWDMMTNSQHSEKLSAIQVRWKGLRVCYKRYLRKILEARSGSGSKRVVPYVHAEELEFLRPSMELTETQSSWQVAQEGQEAPPEPQGSQEHCSLDEKMTQEMNIGYTGDSWP